MTTFNGIHILLRKQKNSNETQCTVIVDPVIKDEGNDVEVGSDKTVYHMTKDESWGLYRYDHQQETNQQIYLFGDMEKPKWLK